MKYKYAINYCSACGKINPDYTRCKECGAEKETHKQQTEDAISRQAALDVIAETDITNGTEPVFTGKQVQALLRDLPSVTPKQRTGHWIEVTNGRGGHECNLCHKYAPSYQDGDEWLTKHCPNCGARMEEQA